MNTPELNTKKEYQQVPIHENYENEGKIPIKYGCGVRHIQALLVFGCLTCNLIARAHLSVTIVAMTDVPKHDVINDTRWNNSHFKIDLNTTYDDLDDTINDNNEIKNISLSNRSDYNAHQSSSLNKIFTPNDETIQNNNLLNYSNDSNDFTPENINISTGSHKNNTYQSNFENNLWISVTEVIIATANKIASNDSLKQNDGNNYSNTATNYNYNDTFHVKLNNSGLQDSSKGNENINESFYKNIGHKSNYRNTNTASSDSVWNVYRKYSWNKATQEMVLGSFFLGYLIMMTPMGLVVQRWGGKIPLQIGLTVSGLVTFATPWLAAWGDWRAVCATRIALGLAQTGTFPGIHCLLAKWVPATERGSLSTYVYTGATIGAVIAFQIGGLLAASPLGWPAIFWCAGALCLIMALLLTVFGAASPLQHQSISQEERNYILGRVSENSDGDQKRPSTPWRAILTSKPVWAVFIGHVGTASIYMFLFTQIPTYLHHILGVNVKSSGTLSSLPYLFSFLASIFFGKMTDYCTNNNILTCKQTRMISNSIATMIPAVCLAGLSFTDNTTLAVALLIIITSTQAACHTGWMVNYIDLAPNYSGTLLATGASMLNIITVLLPVFVSNIVTHVDNPYQWRVVMATLTAFTLVCNTIYMVFISTDVQPWNEPHYLSARDKDVTRDEERKQSLGKRF